MKAIAIILARGGSKGIKNKNLINFCGKSLITWTISQCKNCDKIENVYVSSDSKKILDISNMLGAQTIKRPPEISEDTSTSESGWLHALDHIKANHEYLPELIVAPQVTSPVRESNDFSKALEVMTNKNFDSLLSVNEINDYFIWSEKKNKFKSENYDFKNRRRRQIISKKYHENGSFYIFKPSILYRFNNRLGGKIGIFVMENYKSIQIDEFDDVKLCEVIMKGYNLNEN